MLLTLHAAEVCGAIEGAGTDILERIDAIELMTTSIKAQVTLTVADRSWRADLNTTEGIDDSNEAGEVNFDVVVDPDIAHRFEGLDEKWCIAPSEGRVDFGVGLTPHIARTICP